MFVFRFNVRYLGEVRIVMLLNRILLLGILSTVPSSNGAALSQNFTFLQVYYKLLLHSTIYCL
jgi:hypothetical protein